MNVPLRCVKEFTKVLALFFCRSAMCPGSTPGPGGCDAEADEGLVRPPLLGTQGGGRRDEAGWTARCSEVVVGRGMRAADVKMWHVFGADAWCRLLYVLGEQKKVRVSPVRLPALPALEKKRV